ncbi:LemA family protein [bacterium]|nr:LemA family protein [bacterium]MBU1025501.1 LemA family protein [bacterium]
MFIIFAAGLVLYFIITYNRFIRSHNLVKEAWSGIDVQLKRRHNLIPNIVETVKGYSKHEKQLLEDIVLVRSNVDKASSVNERGETEIALSKSLRNLFAVAESYPELKANENFIELQKELSEMEKDISLARRYYNGAVRNLNILVESFPGSLVAQLTGFKQADYFEIEYAVQREAPDVKFSE